MMPATCSKNINPPKENSSPYRTRCHFSHGEQCDCGNCNQLKADGNGHFLSPLDSKPMSHVSNNERSDFLYQSDCTTSAGNYLIVQRSLHDPLFVATTRNITSYITNNPPSLNSFHTINQNGGSQNEFTSGTRTTFVLGSTTPLHQFSLLQSPFGLPSNLFRSICPAILPSYAIVDPTFRLGQASASSGDNVSQNETQIDLWRQILMEWTLYMHRPADSLLEDSNSIFIVTANHGVNNFRLVTENAGATYQRPVQFSIEMRNNRSGTMWFDVDNMSYEELLDLEDHIGYVSTGLSEEAAVASIKRSNYFLFTEENAQKDFCSICQEDFVEEDELGTLDCGHGFHISCIKQWLGYKNVCPICKSPGLGTARPSVSYEDRSIW